MNSLSKNCCVIKRSLFLCYLLYCCTITSLVAQNEKLDSLLQLLPNLSEDSSKVDVLNTLSYEYHLSDIKKTLEFGEKALILSEKLSYQKGIGTAFSVLSIGHAISGNVEKSISLDRKSLTIGKALQDNYLIARACNNLGISLSSKGEYKDALLFYQQSLQAKEKTGDLLGQAYTLSNIALLHLANNNKAQAKQYFLKASKLAKQSNNPNGHILASMKLGKLYLEEKELEKATAHLEEAYRLAKKVNNQYDLSAITGHLGFLSIEKGNKELAIYYAHESIKHANNMNDERSLIQCYNHLAELYQKTGDLEAAIRASTTSLQLSQTYLIAEFEVINYKDLSILYATKGDFKKAYHASQQHLLLKDSLLSKEKITQINELEEKYQSEKKEHENALLKVKEQQQQAIINNQEMLGIAMGFIILLLMLLGIISCKAYLSKKSSHDLLEEKVKERTEELQISNIQLKNTNEELERFTYISSHDLKQPLLNIWSFVQLLEKELKPIPHTKVYDCLAFINQNTVQMRKIIEDILEYSSFKDKDEALTSVNIKKCIEQIGQEMRPVLVKKQASIEIHDNLPNINGHYSKIYFLFKNLLENGLKYNEESFPLIQIKYQADAQFHMFSITDNGIGIEAAHQAQVFTMFKRLHTRATHEGTGLGLSLCKKIVTEYGGNIWLESELGKGSTFYFKIPKIVVFNPVTIVKKETPKLLPVQAS